MAQNNTHGIVIPEGFTEETINTLKDANAARKAAKRFKPPIPLTKCTKIEEVKERLRVGLRKARGEMRDLQGLDKLMSKLKQEDADNRRELIHMFNKMEKILSSLDTNFKDQLEKEEMTKNHGERIQNFRHLLRQEDCPVLVVGQVSSGKSSLLNLFLGEEYLPSQMLSCTASICELAYGPQPAAKLVYVDGREQAIRFEDKDKYIFKEDNRLEKYEHQAVRLSLPVPFLKSGIMLIDTPGIGENPVMENVLIDYVKKKNAFGFIFVIKCNDSGGVLQRFKNLLRKMADIKDEHGQKKLDPKSVLFVANFWDLVPDNEKEETRERIIDTLTRENSLAGFNPDTQLFFMNTKYSWATWKENMISEDYDSLISGIEEFFPVGHKRKLEVAYLWLERMIDKVLNPLRIFLASAKKPKKEIQQETQRAQKDLTEVDKKLKTVHQELITTFKQKKDRIKSLVLYFLQTKEAEDEVTYWKTSEIYHEEVGDAWILIEERLDKAIDDRIASVLENWESDIHAIDMASTEIVDTTRTHLKEINASLKTIEKRLWTANPDFELESWSYDPVTGESIKDNRATSSEKEPRIATPPDLLLTSTNRWKIMVQEHPKRLVDTFFSKSGLFRSIFKQKRGMRNVHEEYQRDKVTFMKGRSGDVLKHMLTNGKVVVDGLIDQQLAPVGKYVTDSVADMKASITSDSELLQNIKKDRKSRELLENVYVPMEKKMAELFERSIIFRLRHLLLYDYPNGCLKRSESFKERHKFEPAKAIQQSGLFGEITHIQLVHRNEKRSITAKRYRQAITVDDAYLKYNDIFFHIYNLSILQTQDLPVKCIPQLLGIAQQGPAMVFAGHLRIASEVLFKGKQSQEKINVFLTKLGSGLAFLHERKLVNMDLCLDSILINENDEPLLMNMYYPIEVPFPNNLDQSLGNYLYLPPEVFPKKLRDSSSFGSRIIGNRLSHRYEQSEKLYTSAADMYAMAMLSMELFVGQDAFANFKSKSINQFMEIKGPAAEIRQTAQRAAKRVGLSEGKLKLCLDCLYTRRTERKRISDWNDTWKAVQ